MKISWAELQKKKNKAEFPEQREAAWEGLEYHFGLKCHYPGPTGVNSSGHRNSQLNMLMFQAVTLRWRTVTFAQWSGIMKINPDVHRAAKDAELSPSSTAIFPALA